MDNFKKAFSDVSKLDDHQLARLEKKLKTAPRAKLRLPSDVNNADNGTEIPDISDMDAGQLLRLEKKVRTETLYRRISPGKIDTENISEDEWRDIFDQPDVLRQPDPSENRGATMDFPFWPAEYFRHARISLRKKLMRSAGDRREVFSSFMAGALSDNIVMLQAMRLWLDKIYISGPGSRFQDFFISQFATINAVKERKERHVAALFETAQRIENLPGISIEKVEQLNLSAVNQLVNNAGGIHKSPADIKEMRNVSGD